jgi:hypothetical protein
MSMRPTNGRRRDDPENRKGGKRGQALRLSARLALHSESERAALHFVTGLEVARLLSAMGKSHSHSIVPGGFEV